MISLERLQELFTLENIQAAAGLLISVFLFFMSINSKVEAFFANRREAKARTELQEEQESHAMDNAVNAEYLAYVALALNKVILASKLSPAEKEQLQEKYINLQVSVRQGFKQTLEQVQEARNTATKTVEDVVQAVVEVTDILGNVVKQ